MSLYDENSLIKKAQSGDCDAFEKLVYEHEKLVYNLALRLLGNEQDAQDAFQEAFIKAWTGLNSFRGDSKFSVWLYRLANNVCMDMLRQRKKDALSLTVSDSSGEDTMLDVSDPAPGPHELLEHRENMEQLNRAIKALPEDHRRILMLREETGLSYEEIAAVLELDLGTVKSRIFRARKKLCSLMGKNGNFSANKASNHRKGGEQA